MRTLISSVIFTLLGTFPAASHAATEITATYRLPPLPQTLFAVPFGNTGITPPAVRVAQSFTAEVGGWLNSVSVAAASLDLDPSGLSIAVTSLTDEQPGTILATAPLQGLYDKGVFTDVKSLNATADFSGSQVMLEANEKYALLFIADRLNGHFNVLGHQTVLTPYGYPGGAILHSTSGAPFITLPIGELMFEVTVTTIPEPTGLMLLSLAGLSSLSRRFRF
jgi:hypothetical protein